MLSHQDNETLVRVGPGTAMGDLFRLYWIPFLPSKDLAPDGQPQRVRLLGEDLVAFRGTDGKVGLVDHQCPHRGAPMVFARNEDCGLRCVYHGWKFNAEGAVEDMPAEPVRSRLKERIRIKAYPVQERNGMLWAYMGPDDEKTRPPLPHLEWNLVPAENIVVSVRVQECNWLQALEGEIDSAHAPILHGRIDSGGSINQWIAKRDLRPTFECIRQDFGMSIASRRALDEERLYWRVNQFVMPFYSLVPPQAKYSELSGHAWVPIDDEHTLCIMFSYVPHHAMYERTRKLMVDGHEGRETGHASQHAFQDMPMTAPYARYWPKYNRENSYRFDYAAQQTTYFSGLPGLWVQDGACQSGERPIFDRTKENLCTSDTGIAMTRRVLLEHAGALRERAARPQNYADPDLYMVRAVSLTLPKSDIWSDVGAPHMKAELGKDFGYAL